MTADSLIDFVQEAVDLTDMTDISVRTKKRFSPTIALGISPGSLVNI